jgi:hypothetical protein
MFGSRMANGLMLFHENINENTVWLMQGDILPGVYEDPLSNGDGSCYFSLAYQVDIRHSSRSCRQPSSFMNLCYLLFS